MLLGGHEVTVSGENKKPNDGAYAQKDVLFRCSVWSLICAASGAHRIIIAAHSRGLPMLDRTRHAANVYDR